MSKLIYRSDGRRSPQLYQPTLLDRAEANPGTAAWIAVALICLLLAAMPAHAANDCLLMPDAIPVIWLFCAFGLACGYAGWMLRSRGVRKFRVKHISTEWMEE